MCLTHYIKINKSINIYCANPHKLNPMASLINGKEVAARLRDSLRVSLEEMKASTLTTVWVPPKLVAVIVGDRPDSATYVRMKTKACAEVGIESEVVRLPSDTTMETMQALIKRLSDDASVHGILVQLPLPSQLEERTILEAIHPSKDVDGFHAAHLGMMAMGFAGHPLPSGGFAGHPLPSGGFAERHSKGKTANIPISCTPKGIMHLLDAYDVELEGKEVVVVGRSSIVGLPVALLAMRRSATVTICHSRTKDLPSHLARADVVIAACGKPHFIRGEWLKPGVVVIDVGINAIDAPDTKRGYRLVGDVAFDEAVKVASLITPVPGGVGPMTVACLLENLMEAFARQVER